MRNVWWFSILMTVTLLLSSCAPASVSASLGNAVAHGSDPEAQDVPVAKEAEIALPDDDQTVNECLNCHEDKARLIETAKPEEVVEAESSGVG
jgi:hypothetical protein